MLTLSLRPAATMNVCFISSSVFHFRWNQKTEGISGDGTHFLQEVGSFGLQLFSCWPESISMSSADWLPVVSNKTPRHLFLYRTPFRPWHESECTWSYDGGHICHQTYERRKSISLSWKHFAVETSRNLAIPQTSKERGKWNFSLSFKLLKNISNIKDAERRVNIVAHFNPPRLRLKSGQTLSPLTL